MRRTYSVMSSIDISLLPFAYLWLTLTSTSLMKGARPPLLLLRFKKNDDDDEKWKALSGYFSKSVIYSSIYARVSLVNKRPCFSLFSVKSTIQIKIVFMRPCVYFPKFNEDIFYTFRNIHIDGLQMLYTYLFSYWLTLLFWHVRYTMLLFVNYTFKSLFAFSALLAAILSYFPALSSPPIATASSFETFSVTPNVSAASSAGHNASVTPELDTTSLLFRHLIAFSFR